MIKIRFEFLVLFIIVLCLNGKVLAQTLELRPSLGWGHGWGYNYVTETNDINPPYKTSFDKPIVPNFQLPQMGIMLDYNYKNKWIISIGRMHGKTELSMHINAGTLSGSALLQKLGGEFYYSICQHKKKLRCFVFAGAFFANNTNFNYNAGNMTFSTLDSNKKVVNKSYDTSVNIKPYGAILSCGIRLSFYNIKKNRERCSITFNYDYGLKNLWTFKKIIQYDYLDNYYIAYSTSKGNQIKIYFSKPIKLYDLKKDKYRLF